VTELTPIITAGVVTLLTLGASIWASRRFGLPGLAREVDVEQGKLVAALRENNTLLRAENAELKVQNAALLEQNKLLREENRSLRYRLAVAYGDIAVLYRGQGKRVPDHVLETKAALATDQQEHNDV
jgi:regulator of replication initiation timing